MIPLVKPPKYRDLGRSFELLKTNWRVLKPDQLWPLLRSITVREHLHTTGYFERNFASKRVVNSSYLLRRRRQDIARRLLSMGCEVSDMLFAHSLPKGRGWRDAVTKLQGTRPNTSLERTRDR
jgi:methylphosphotriester-DNA--protein-cysteine methyltransferase